MKINTSFLNIFEQIIKNDYNNSYRTRKRDEIIYFKEILKLTYSTPYWSRYYAPISGKLLNKKHNEYIKRGYYEKLYTTVLNKYIDISSYYRFKFISTDTCFIPNKYCSNLNRNKFYKSKKGLKLSSITDANGIPLSLIINNGNIYDSKIFIKTYNSMKVSTSANKYKHSNKHKQYFLADKGYSTNQIDSFLIDKGYSTIIPQNKRNIKDPSKIIKLTDKQKKLYKKRIVIENSFSWIKQFVKLTGVYEKSMKNYLNITYLAVSYIIHRRFLQ